jgi:ribosomal protein S6--L-glutamate ligase
MTGRFVSFDPLRTLNIQDVIPMKPEQWLKRRNIVQAADWILFPEYWQVNTLVYGWKKKIFPSISSFHLGHDKVEMTRVFQAVCPRNTPFTQILAHTETAIEQVLDGFCFPFVAKEVRNSMGRGVFLIETREDFLIYAQANAVMYVQEYLPISRDLRLVLVGSKVVAGYWRKAAHGQFLNNVSQGGSVSFEDIPEGAVKLVEAFAGQTGINHAGFDMADVDGHYYFLEFNTRFGTRALIDRGIQLSPYIQAYLNEKRSNRSSVIVKIPWEQRTGL